MYKAKILTMDGLGSYIQSNHKVGDIIEFCDERYNRFYKDKVIEHYRMVTTSKKKCKCCGAWIIKRKKEKWRND